MFVSYNHLISFTSQDCYHDVPVIHASSGTLLLGDGAHYDKQYAIFGAALMVVYTLDPDMLTAAVGYS